MNLRIINFSLGIVVFISALGLGAYLALTDAIPGLYGWKRLFLIGVLFLYGSFRFYRAFRGLRNVEDVEA